MDSLINSTAVYPEAARFVVSTAAVFRRAEVRQDLGMVSIRLEAA